MTSPTAAIETTPAFFSALDEANFFLELDQFDAAESSLELARQMAGDQNRALLLVGAARLCLLVQSERHWDAVKLIDDCLQRLDSHAEEGNDSLRTDLLVQRALSLCELQRWKEALDTLRRPEMPQDSPDLQSQIVRCLRALQQSQSARDRFAGAHSLGIPGVQRRDQSLAFPGL